MERKSRRGHLEGLECSAFQGTPFESSRENISSFSSFLTRLPTRLNYLPPAKEIKGRGERRRSRRRSRLNQAAKRSGEPNTRGRGRRGSVIYGERDGPCAFVCARGRTSRRYQDVGFRGTPKGSSPFLSEPSSSSSSSLMCMPCFYLLFPPAPLSSLLLDGPHSIFLMLQRCTPATRAFTSWRVSRDEEIRFTPRENGVIIYEGG